MEFRTSDKEKAQSQRYYEFLSMKEMTMNKTHCVYNMYYEKKENTFITKKKKQE